MHEFDARMRCYLWNDIFDAHRDNGKRLVVHAHEKLAAFVELESGDSGLRLSAVVSSKSEACNPREHQADQTYDKYDAA